MKKKLLFVVNEDRFFLSHRKEIALTAQQKGWEVTIVCKDTGQRQDVESLGLPMMELPIHPTGMNLREVNWKKDYRKGSVCYQKNVSIC